MTIRSKSTLKTYFNTGDIPTEANFADWIDSIPTRSHLTVGPAGSDADYVCDGTADDVQIQAAIDAAAALPTVGGISSMAEIELLRGLYNIAATIDLKSDVHMKLNQGTLLNPVVDVDCINVKYGGSICGGMIRTSGVSYTSSAIKIDGSSHVYWTGYPVGAYLHTSISDMTIYGGNITDGYGIYFLADEITARGFINGVTVRDIAIWKHKYAIKLEVANLGSQPGNSVGGNLFQNVNMWFPKYGIHMVTATFEQVNGNTFENVHIYADPTDTLKCIYCEGSYNYFEPIWCWDTGVGNKSLEFAGLSVKNRASGIFGGGLFVTQRDASNHIDDYFV